jgi:hypothetical protein
MLKTGGIFGLSSLDSRKIISPRREAWRQVFLPHSQFCIHPCRSKLGFASAEAGIDLVQRVHQPIGQLDHLAQLCWHQGWIAQIEQQHAGFAPAITIPPGPFEDPQGGTSYLARVIGRALEGV